MEERVIVACPNCSAQYKVRQETLGRIARCSKCQKTFPLYLPDPFNEDEVLNWVDKKDDPDSDADDEAEVSTATVAGLNVLNEITKSSPGLEIPLKLLNLDRQGVHFRFSPQMLNSEKFRSSFPRRCAGCLDKKNLRVFLVRWPVKGVFPAGYGDVHGLHPVTNLKELPAVSATELLKFLPLEKGLPEPFGLPFPYFVCGRCKPEGLVSSPFPVEGKDNTCVISIFNPNVALEFYTANCGRETQDYQKMQTHCGLRKISIWESLPESDRKRITRWYKSTANERFICFVPDLDTPKDHKGRTGIVLTNERIVCGKDPLLRQFSFQEPVTLSCHTVPEGRKVDISSPTQSRIAFHFCDTAWVDLKHSLRDLKVSARVVEV
jgi:predicted Zn finger-like uncharacterized protein